MVAFGREFDRRERILLSLTYMTQKEYKQFTQYFDDEAYYHGGAKSSYTDYSYQGVIPAIRTYADCIEAFFPDLPREAMVLDIGCAKGYLVKELLDRGYEAYGFDISPYAINEGQKEFRELRTRTCVGDLVEGKTTVALNGKEATKPLFQNFDLIICSETLEHIPEEFLDSAIENIFDTSKKYALLDMPFEGEEGGKDKTHITIHNREWWNEKISPYFTYETTDQLQRFCWNFFPLVKKTSPTQKG